MVKPVGRDGHFDADVRLVGGQFFKHADADLVRELESRGVLFRHVAYEHSYPHCWRCHTPLMYYALPAWYIRTTAIKDALLRENEKTNWYPETIKWGRYGDWLQQQRRLVAVAQPLLGHPAADLAQRRRPDHLDLRRVARRAVGATPVEDLSELDPHRPFVDDVTFTLPGVDGTFRRVPR